MQVFSLIKSQKNEQLLAFHTLIISISVYIKSGFTCKAAAVLHQHSAVAQKMSLFWHF